MWKGWTIMSHPGSKSFSRKDYMGHIQGYFHRHGLSRPEKKGVEMKLFKKIGDKNKTIYHIS